MIFQNGTYINPWGAKENSRHTEDPFAGPWNHWPVSMIPSDGRFAVSNDRLTHAAVAAADNVTGHGNMAIYGFNKNDISTLVPLARFWNNPPALSHTRGCMSKGYDKAQRAYVLQARNMNFSFTIESNAASPVVNPAFVVKNWVANQKATLEVNGRRIPSNKQCRQGIVRDTDGKPMLIVWLKMQSNEYMDVVISANRNK